MHVILSDRKFDSLRCWPLLVLLIVVLSSFCEIAAVDATIKWEECSKEEKTEVRKLLAALPGEWWSSIMPIQILRNICIDIPGEFREGLIERLRLRHSYINKTFVISLWRYLFGWDCFDRSTENRQDLTHKNGAELGERLIKVCLTTIQLNP